MWEFSASRHLSHTQTVTSSILLHSINKMWRFGRVTLNDLTAELGKTVQIGTVIYFFSHFTEALILTHHAIFHLGISSYLRKCIREARWEVERVIDFTWVHYEKGAKLIIKSENPSSDSFSRYPYWVAFITWLELKEHRALLCSFFLKTKKSNLLDYIS